MPKASACTPSSGGQVPRRAVTSTRQPPPRGTHLSSTASSSQLSNTRTRGSSLCQAEPTSATWPSSGKPVKSGCRLRPRPQLAISAGVAGGISGGEGGGVGEAEQEHAAGEEPAVAVGELAGELGLADPAHAGHGGALADCGRAAGLERRRQCLQVGLAADEQSVREKW